MKHFELEFSKKILRIALFTLILAIAFFILNTQKAKADNTSTIDIPDTYVNIGEPNGLVMSPDGDIWYVDRLNFRIVKMDPVSNTIVRTVGRLGSGEGEFDANIWNMTIDDEGYLYVLSTNGWVKKLDPYGGFIEAYFLGDIPSPDDVDGSTGITYDAFTDSILITNQHGSRVEKFSTNMEFISGFGSYGSGTSQFNNIWGIVTDGDGRIYVADEFNARVQVFSSDYTYLFEIDHWFVDEVEIGFDAAKSIVILSDGTICVTSQNSSRVVQFAPNEGYTGYTYIRSFGFEGSENSNMIHPQFLIKDSTDHIYVSDFTERSISKYSNEGVFESAFQSNENSPGKLWFPYDVVYDPTDVDGDMLILDGTKRIQEFSATGDYKATVVNAGIIGDSAYHFTLDPEGRLLVSDTWTIKVFTKSDGIWILNTSFGFSTEEVPIDHPFNQARGMAFDSAGNLYVADLWNNRIQKFLPSETTPFYIYDSDFGSGWGGEFAKPYVAPTESQLMYPSDVAIDSNGHIFVGDRISLKEFDEDGVWVQNIGTGTILTPWNLTIDNDLIYVADAWNENIRVYDHSGGSQIDSFGSYGGGQAQFFEPTCITMNPNNHTLTVCDFQNGRVESFVSGYRIINLISSANVIRLDSGHEGESLSNTTWEPSEEDPLTAIPARLMFGDYAVADFTIDLTQDRNWSTVNILTLPLDSKSLIINLSAGSTPGVTGTHSLYLSRYSNQTSVTVCPDATEWADLNAVCDNVEVLTLGSEGNAYPLTEITNLGGKNYWRIDDLSGTGAFSSLFETGFELSDVMTRLMIGIGSNHNILFGTSYDINHSGDTITLTFDPAWDLSTINIGDLALYGGSTSLTLVGTLNGSPADDTWGVSVDNDLNTIVFTSPTNAGSSIQSIMGGNTITVLINNSVLLNPATPESYQISMRLLTDASTNNEVGSVDIAIVDSDTVNIDGYVLSNLFFDMDTGTGETPVGGQSPTTVNCDYNTCLAHSGALDHADNYTVDLGHLNMTGVNKSNTESVLHSDGENGLINSIYFDISTNSASGVILTYQSLYGELRGPGHSITAADDLDIPTTNGSVDIEHGVSAYGIQLAVDPVYKYIGTGTQTVECGHSSTTYCVMGDINPATGVNEQTAEALYTVTGPIELGRGKIDVAAAIDGTVVPGNYTDQITFIATTIF
jgi:tripartite motif-containing protein 71